MTEPLAITRRGTRFLHRRILSTQEFDGKTPQLCEVTRTGRGGIYWRAVYDIGLPTERLGAYLNWFSLTDAPRFVGEIISQPEVSK